MIDDLITEITKKTTLTDTQIGSIFNKNYLGFNTYNFIQNKTILLTSKFICDKILKGQIEETIYNEICVSFKTQLKSDKERIINNLRTNFQYIIQYLNPHQFTDANNMWKVYIKFYNDVNMTLSAADLSLLMSKKMSVKYSELLDLMITNIKSLSTIFIRDLLQISVADMTQLLINIFTNYPIEKFSEKNISLVIKYINIELLKCIYGGPYNTFLLKNIILQYKPNVNCTNQYYTTTFNMFVSCYKEIQSISQLTSEDNRSLMCIALNIGNHLVVTYLLENKFAYQDINITDLYTQNEQDIYKILDSFNKFNIKLDIHWYSHVVNILNKDIATLQPLLKKYTIYQNEADDNKEYQDFLQEIKNKIATNNMLKYLTIEKCLQLILNSELNITTSDIIHVADIHTRLFLYEYLKSTNKIKTVKTVKTLKKVN